MNFSIDLSARVGPPAADPALGDRLLSALGSAAPDAAVSQDAGAGTIGAAFTVDARDAGVASTNARRVFDAALDQLGVRRGELVELHVAESATPPRKPGRVELVSVTEIGRRLNVSRERVGKWAASPTLGFPAPVAKGGRSFLWEWPPVARWAERRHAAKKAAPSEGAIGAHDHKTRGSDQAL